jgi:hypothetical protein
MNIFCFSNSDEKSAKKIGYSAPKLYKATCAEVTADAVPERAVVQVTRKTESGHFKAHACQAAAVTCNAALRQHHCFTPEEHPHKTACCDDFQRRNMSFASAKGSNLSCREKMSQRWP